MPGKAATRTNKKNNGTQKANKPKKPSAKELYEASLAKKGAAAAPAPAATATRELTIKERNALQRAKNQAASVKKSAAVSKGQKNHLAAKRDERYAQARENN